MSKSLQSVATNDGTYFEYLNIVLHVDNWEIIFGIQSF